MACAVVSTQHPAFGFLGFIFSVHPCVEQWKSFGTRERPKIIGTLRGTMIARIPILSTHNPRVEFGRVACIKHDHLMRSEWIQDTRRERESQKRVRSFFLALRWESSFSMQIFSKVSAAC